MVHDLKSNQLSLMHGETPYFVNNRCLCMLFKCLYMYKFYKKYFCPYIIKYKNYNVKHTYIMKKNMYNILKSCWFVLINILNANKQKHVRRQLLFVLIIYFSRQFSLNKFRALTSLKIQKLYLKDLRRIMQTPWTSDKVIEK